MRFWRPDVRFDPWKPGRNANDKPISIVSFHPTSDLVFTMSATTRSYEKSQWTRVRFPTRRDVYVFVEAKTTQKVCVCVCVLFSKELQ